jgi:hypothetical protein
MIFEWLTLSLLFLSSSFISTPLLLGRSQEKVTVTVVCQRDAVWMKGSPAHYTMLAHAASNEITAEAVVLGSIFFFFIVFPQIWTVPLAILPSCPDRASKKNVFFTIV